MHAPAPARHLAMIAGAAKSPLKFNGGGGVNLSTDLRRMALLMLAVATLLGGWFALAPAKVDAQTGSYYGLWVAKYGDAAVCPARADHQTLAGTYQRGSANAITLRFLENTSENPNCGPGNVLTAGDRGESAGQWLIQLRTAAGTGGSLISGAHIGLPSGFSTARAVSGTTYNDRSNTNDGSWPLSSSRYDNAAITFTVPSAHTGAVYLRVSVRFYTSAGYVRWEDFSFKFDEPKVEAHPLVLPLDSGGEPAATDVSVPVLRPSGGTQQRARLLLRAAEHGDAYDAADANAARAAFGSGTLKITSDAAGATAITGATITQSDGSSAIAACTEAAAGSTCTVTSANWPQGSGASPLTEPLDVYFQVPASHTGSAYLVLTAARTNYASRNFALHYAATQVSAYPLAAPQASGGTITTGDLTASSRSWTAAGAAQRAAIFLRDAAHGNEYDSTDTNVARSAFGSAQIEIAADTGGTRPIAGAKIGNSSALTSAISACTETSVGNTCTITSANFPETGSPAKTTQQDIYFSVPDSHEGDAYVVVRASSGTAAPRSFALKYDAPAQTAAHPLPVPVSGGNPVDWDLTLAQRDFAGSAGRQQVRVFLRGTMRTAYAADDASAARSAFDSVTIKVATDEAGASALTGAVISDSAGTVLGACSESTAGNTCTIPSASFPQGTGGTPLTTHQDIWFSVPSGRNSAVWLVVSAAKSGQRASSFALKYDPHRDPLSTFALVNGDTAACPRADGHVVLDAGAYNTSGSTSVTINPRESHYGTGACTTTTAAGGNGLLLRRRGSDHFWKMSLNHAPGDGTPIAGAAITLPASFSAARSGGHNPRTIALDGGRWPNTQASTVASRLHQAAISFTVPAGHSGPVYLYVESPATNLTNTDRGVARATFKFQPALEVHPLVVPGGTADGTDLSASARDFAGGGASQQAQVFLRSAAHSGTYTASDSNVQRAAFDTAVISVASDAAGQNLITDAVISSDSAGATAITACTEATAGNTCTIASGSWPQAATGTPLRTLAQDLHFSVPDGYFGDIYLVVKVSKAGSSSRTFALEYGNPSVQAAPLAVPVDLASGMPNESGDLTSNTRSWAAAGAQRRAKLYLRGQAHGDTFTAADANAAPGAFDTVTIRLASDAAGTAEASGAELVADAAGARISACGEQAAGPTCTIASADWPAAAGLTTELDLRFAVPETYGGDVYLVVTAAKAGELSRRFSLKYDSAYAGAFPLAVPLSSGGTEETGDLKTPMRSFEPGGGSQRARIFLRSAWPDDEYNSSDTNAASSGFTDVTIRIATTSAGGTAAANAKISSDDAGQNVISACTETSVGATCTVTSANWPATSGTTDALDIYWSAPDARTDDAYLVVTVSATGKTSRTFWLKYEPGLPVFPIAVPSGTADGTDLSAGSREFAENGASQQATVYLRAASHSDTYTAADANAADNLFERASLRIATDAEGTSPAAGATISSDAAGNTAISHCAEASPGHTCTIASWPATGGTADSLPLQFSVPHNLGADAYVVVAVKKTGEPNRVFALQYDDPLVQAFPLAVPLSAGGTEESGDLKTPMRSFAAGNETQRARIFLRGAWPDDEYDSSDSNAGSSDFTSVTIRIATSSAGGTAATDAKISSDDAGANVISNCTETAVGATCTVTSANWPATGGTTDALDIYWSVPDARTDDAYLVVTVDGASGKTSRAFWLKYEAGLPVFPLAVPLDGSGTEETGDLSARTGNYLSGAQRQRARVFLRDAAHGSEYLGTQTNVSATGQLFERVVIKLTEDAAGNTPLTGALITDQSGAALSACDEAAAGNTCTIPAASWPASGGTTGAFDLWFSAPDNIEKAVHLHVSVEKTGEPPRAFALPYADPYIAAWPLIVPQPTSSTFESGTLSANTRRWLPETGLNQIAVFLRNQARTSYDGAHANAVGAAFDSYAIKITSDAAGDTLLSNATFTNSSGTAEACANSCTGTNALDTLYFTIPDAHAGAAYIHVSAIKSGKENRTVSLRWDAPLSVSAHPGATPRHLVSAVLLPAGGEFNPGGSADRARISIHTSASSGIGAATTAFDSVKLTLASDADGTALTGAVLASDAAGSTALTGCTEGSTAGNVCTIPAASWPATAGAADELELYFTVPLTRVAAVYLHVRVENAGERDRTFALKYEAPVGARSDSAGLALDPRRSDGMAEQDDDGDGDRTDNEHYYGLAAERQRLAVRIYESSSTANWDARAATELATFASLHSTSALILNATYPTGPQTTTSLNASQIVFTKPDGTALGCSEASYAGGQCTLTRAALKTLMGVTGAADARRSLEFEFAFAIKTAFTSSEDVTLILQLTRHNNGIRTADAVYKRGAAAASNAQPFARPIAADGTAETGNVLMSEDAQAHRFRRYRPGGQDTPVQLLVYDSATELNTYSASTNRVSYGTVSEVKIEVKTRPTVNSLNSGALITGALVKVLKNDGASACTEAAVGNTCTITSANFLAAGPPRAGNHYRALPLEFHFSVPSGHVTPNFGNANLVVTVVRTGSGTLAQRTKTFALPFDGGTRARPFAMAADQTGAAPADNQQYAPAGALTPVWLHVYNSEKSAHEAPSTNNTAQYWEFDQTAGATVLTIELLDQDGRAHGTISAAGSAAKFAPCTESRPGPTCSITLPALKALDAGTVTDDDHVDPLRFSVSVPYGSADSVRIKATVRRSDEVPGQSGVKQTKTGEFTLYAPPAYGLALPLLDGAPATGAISDRGWEYLPRGRPTPLALQLRDAPSLAGGAGRAHLQDFETVTIRALQPDGAALAGAKITARSGSALAACSPAAAVCEVSRAEWPSAGAALADRDLRFALAVPAAYQQAAVIRVEVSHSRRNPPAAALPATERTAGAGPLQTIGLADDAGTRTAYYELRLASPVKRAFALALTAADAGALRLCTKAETEDGPAACAAPSAQRGAPLGFAAAIVRTASAHPADPPSDSGDELVEYREISELRVRATGASVHHRALCPRAASEPEHPQFQPAVQSNPANCTISSDALRRFHGDDANDPIRPLQLALIPTAAGGRATVEYAIAGGAETILRHLDFTAAPGSPQLAAALFLDWADPGSDFDAARPEALFTIGRKDSRAAAVPAPASALPGGLAPATFAQAGLGAATGSVQLSINQGSLSFADRPCSAAGGPCALAIAAAELRGSADPADPVGTFHAEYRLPFDAAGPTTVSIAVRNAAGGAAAEGALAIEHPSASRPAAFAALPADADASAAPGGPAIELAAGLRVALAAPGPGWSCLRADPSFLELDNDGTAQNACALARTAAGASATAAWLDDASYLALSGPAAFDNGAKRLPLGGTNPFNQLRCGPAKDNGLAAAADRDLACWAADAQGNRPKISIDPDSDGSQVRLIANLVPAQAADGEAKRFTLLAGDGATRPANRSAQAAAFLIAGSGDSGALFLAGPAAFSIAAVQQAASASLQRSGADPDAPVRTGEPAALSLAVLNANGQAAEPAAISSITLIAAQGMLRAGTATDPDAFCDGRNTCTIPLQDDDQITGNDLASAARTNPRLPAAIPVQLYGVAAPGAVQVSAAVVATDGAQPILAGPVSVEFAGRASSLALGQRLQRLHSANTLGDDPDTDTVETGDARVDAGDLLDQITISVSAADAGGRAAPLPRGISSQINGPASDDDPLGPPVPAARLNATLDQCNPARTMCSYLVDADAPASDPLPSGVYTLTASIGTAGEASARFGVAGPPASIQLQAAPLPQIGATFTIQITVTDAHNEPVADGTPISLTLDPRGDAPPAAQLASTAQLATANGQATARLALIGREISILHARAGQASKLHVIDARQARQPGQPQPPTEDGPAARLSSTQPNDFTLYRGTQPASAATLARELGPNSAIFFWNGKHWLRFATRNNAPIPGSTNFPIHHNDILWITH